jgi:hypothetical protein
MITITSKQDMFRRCGIAHPARPTEYPDDAFSPDQLEILRAEPMLTIVVTTDPAKNPAANYKRKL